MNIDQPVIFVVAPGYELHLVLAIVDRHGAGKLPVYPQTGQAFDVPINDSQLIDLDLAAVHHAADFRFMFLHFREILVRVDFDCGISSPMKSLIRVYEDVRERFRVSYGTSSEVNELGVTRDHSEDRIRDGVLGDLEYISSHAALLQDYRSVF